MSAINLYGVGGSAPKYTPGDLERLYGGKSAGGPFANWNAAHGVTGPTTATGTTGSLPQQGAQNNLSALPDITQLTEAINKLNLAAQQSANNARIPNAAGLEQKSSDMIGQELSGVIPADVMAQINQRAAERGVAGGFSGSPNENAAALRALGLTSLDLQNRGQQHLTAAEGRNPAAPLFDPTSQLMTPYQQAMAELQKQQAQLDAYLKQQQLAMSQAQMQSEQARQAQQAWLQQQQLAIEASKADALNRYYYSKANQNPVEGAYNPLGGGFGYSSSPGQTSLIPNASSSDNFTLPATTYGTPDYNPFPNMDSFYTDYGGYNPFPDPNQSFGSDVVPYWDWAEDPSFLLNYGG